ncbi:hypothetical protein [Novosphingobium humi]|uniref:hypothetical protein n=1 Tax=Novosphingobium humi TaxID=2282397 RepID=UPI0025B279FA|nr:hypothetical protein [Novosphingobium humi]WJS98376.1 hypothetical protein NYQ05_14830 [Novosphingobium humi]
MPRTKKAKPQASEPPNHAMNVVKEKDEKDRIAIAKTLLGPGFRHASALAGLHGKQFGQADFMPGLGDYADALRDLGDKAVKGDLALASRLLAAQALTLDSIFAETARRMASNMGEHLPAMEIYARIAMKAQTNSRATLEALAKLHAPREQTVRHVHVNEGGQAVIADQFHHHAGQPTGGQENGQPSEQPHAPDHHARVIGGASGQGAALPCPDAGGRALPIASGERGEAVPDARRGQE